MKKNNSIITSILFLLVPTVIFCSSMEDLQNNTPQQGILQHPLVQKVKDNLITGAQIGGTLVFNLLQAGYTAATAQTQESMPFIEENNSDTSSDVGNFQLHEDVENFELNESEWDFIGARDNDCFTNQTTLQKTLETAPENAQNQFNEKFKIYFKANASSKTTTQRQVCHMFALIKRSQSEKHHFTLASEILNLYNHSQLSELNNCITLQQNKQEKFETKFQNKIKEAIKDYISDISTAEENFKTKLRAAKTEHDEKLQKSFKKAGIRAFNLLQINEKSNKNVDCSQAQEILQCNKADDFQALLIKENQNIQRIITHYKQELDNVEKIISAIQTAQQDNVEKAQNESLKRKEKSDKKK